MHFSLIDQTVGPFSFTNGKTLMDLRNLTASFRPKRKRFRSNLEEDFIQRGKSFTQREKEFHSKRKELYPKRKGVRPKEKRRFAQRRKESNLQNEILQQRGVGADGIGYLRAQDVFIGSVTTAAFSRSHLQAREGHKRLVTQGRRTKRFLAHGCECLHYRVAGADG